MATEPQLEIDVQALMRGLVHELRNPLSAILTASSLLPGAEGLDDESVMLLDVITKESRRMNRILSEFSTFAKPPRTHLIAIDLAEMTRDVARNETQDEPAIRIHDELPSHLWAFADAHLTIQALHNVFKNAGEALPEGGHIRLTGGEEGGHAWVAVNDSGAGLSAQSLERAFQPFFSTKPAATGLGLSIARVAIRASEGDCRIENAHDGGPSGAIVTVELPIAPRERTSQT